MKIEKNFLVVSDYNWLPEDLNESWIHKYTDNYPIYDRYHRFPESDKIKWQKNVGQNIYDIFDFIITHYDNLPDNTIFCRASFLNPMENKKPLSAGNCRVETFEKLMNNTEFTPIEDHYHIPEGNGHLKGDDGGYTEINTSWYFDSHPGKYYKNLNTFLYYMYVDPIIPSYIRFAPGGNYIIPKANILRYSKKFYEYIREILSWDILVGEAHMIERCLYTIFTCNWEVNEMFK